MTIAGTLYELEKIDSDLEMLEATLRDMRQRQGQNPALETAERRLDATRRQLQVAEGEQRDLEGQLADLATRIERDDKRLYSGQIVDAREIASLERELARYREARDGLEERCLDIMERVERLEAEAAELSRQANTLRERWEADRESLGIEAEGVEDSLAGMRELRGQVAASLDPRTLDQYSRIRRSSGHAVSAVSQGVCSACRVAVPAKDIQHARGEEIVSCTNCGRILVVP